MKNGKAIARAEIKNLVVTIGLKNIRNYHLNEIRDRTGVSVVDMQNALNYFQLSPQTAKYR